jgi:hypothetical protein
MAAAAGSTQLTPHTQERIRRDQEPFVAGRIGGGAARRRHCLPRAVTPGLPLLVLILAMGWLLVVEVKSGLDALRREARRQ